MRSQKDGTMESINRRHFLKTSAMAAAVSSLGHASSPNGANSWVRVAVVGVHGRGQEHIQGFSKLSSINVELAALCDIDEGVVNGRLNQVEKSKGKRPIGYTD